MLGEAVDRDNAGTQTICLPVSVAIIMLQETSIPLLVIKSDTDT